MNRFITAILVLMSVLLLSACPSSTVKMPPEPGMEGIEGVDTGVETSAIDEDCKPPCVFPRSALNDPDGPLARRLVFFDFDKSNIRDEYEELIINHGQYLSSNPDVRVRLEGHTDEQGSREYNLALGEQRAQKVRALLLSQGANSANITVVSFGEELPLDLGHMESAWSQNRRVELVYEDSL